MFRASTHFNTAVHQQHSTVSCELATRRERTVLFLAMHAIQTISASIFFGPDPRLTPHTHRLTAHHPTCPKQPHLDLLDCLSCSLLSGCSLCVCITYTPRRQRQDRTGQQQTRCQARLDAPRLLDLPSPVPHVCGSLCSWLYCQQQLAPSGLGDLECLPET